MTAEALGLAKPLEAPVPVGGSGGETVGIGGNLPPEAADPEGGGGGEPVGIGG